MALGARPTPARALIGNGAAVGHPTDIAEFARDASPLGAMPDSWACESVRYLMQQHLVDVIVVEALGEVPRHRDAFAGEVTQARTARGAVEVEAP